MKVGVTVHFQFSFFSAGSPQTALAIGEVLRCLGHDVQFVNVHKKEEWWDDVKSLKAHWNVVHLEDLITNKTTEPPFDFLVEVGQHYLEPAQRVQIAKRSVWLVRKGAVLQDIEATLFPCITKEKRDLTGVSEIWMFRELVSTDDIDYIETQTRLPVRQIPWFWTPSAIELQRAETKAPLWQQVAALPEVKERPWQAHVCETNSSSSSSSTIPLFILAEVTKKSSKDIQIRQPIYVHNADNIKGNDFFNKNVLEKVQKDISCEYVGRQRVIDFVFAPKSIVFAHSRFLPLRYYLLDCIWAGVPIVHNSKFLADALGGSVQKGYYPDNDLILGRKAAETLMRDESIQSIPHVMELRKKIFEQWSPFSSSVQKGMREAIDACIAKEKPIIPSSIFTVSKISEKSTEVSEQKVPEKSTEVSTVVSTEVSTVVSTVVPTIVNTKELRIGFCDMWDQFNPEYNMFTLLLEEAGKSLGYTVKGMSLDQSEDVHIVLFGPFGNRWRSVKEGIPLVHYTGENTEPIQDARVKLNLGFKHLASTNYLRLPLWMLEINWFNADVDRIQNPKPMPVAYACSVPPSNEFEEKHKKFCAFVVSNPRNEFRNSAFHWLNSYKQVDSAGRLFNNVGDVIFAGLGGGGGELKKMEFYRDYRFALTFENESSDGYCTEKMLHAKAAGCIPIYWGDPQVELDFEPEGFLDARNISTPEELIRLVKEVEENPEKLERMRSVPALNATKSDLVRRTLSECAKRIWLLSGLVEKEKCETSIPEFLGCKAESIIQTPKTNLASVGKTVFVTAANTRFLPSLQLWLQSVSAQKQKNQGLQVLVYMMADVTSGVIDQYKEAFPFAEIQRFPTETPDDFKDMWNPEHFAWKIWLLHKIVHDEEYKEKLIFYSDAGSMMCRYPYAWLNVAVKEGICVLEDERQINRTWCHANFRKALQTTAEELASQQLWAGSLAFVGGHPLACVVLNEAWKWAQKRDVIVGSKAFAPYEIVDECYGHRHDQSILSIVSQRQKVPRFPLDDVHGHISLRQTFLAGASIYVHRGQFTVHKPMYPGIDNAWVINLDRRKDRLEKLKKAHPELSGYLLRMPAFDGRELKLTSKLARLFAPHDFKWKKAVMGCALSHLALWMKLINDKPEINSYLVLEDDVVLKDGWNNAWTRAWESKSIPDDWDVVYLGGILPPNREGFEAVCVDKVNDFVGRVKPNQVFGQPSPTRYMHFCAYAYVLSRRGAMKVIEYMKSRGGYWTSADHMICNLYDILNIYFLHPLVAGCYQDSDPIYQTSAFNDFSRKDNFDSDLWNNNDHFSKEEVEAVLPTASQELDILGALEDARGTPEPKVETKPNTTDMVGQIKQETKQSEKRRFVSIAGPKMNMENLFEFAWFKQLFEENAKLSLEIEDISSTAVQVPPTDEPIVVLQRPYVHEAYHVLEKWKAKGVGFYILHISDEFSQDPIDFYAWDCCKGVIRNYLRPDVQESDKVKIVPIGFHWAASTGETPKPLSRELVWSFVGTGWKGRREKLEILKQIPGEHKLIFQESWESKDKLGRDEMLGFYLNSWCIPCPGGQNPETFRAYEALEAGAIPVFVKEDGSEVYLAYLSRWLPLLHCDTWLHAAQLIMTLKAKPEIYEQYRIQVLAGWETMKKEMKRWVSEVYHV